MNKSSIIKNLVFASFSLLEMYVIFGKKYLKPESFLALFISHELGNQIHISMQEDNAGGTTPYNPLKIPAKIFSFTPANLQPKPKPKPKPIPPPQPSTPLNPLKIPAKNISPIPPH